MSSYSSRHTTSIYPHTSRVTCTAITGGSIWMRGRWGEMYHMKWYVLLQLTTTCSVFHLLPGCYIIHAGNLGSQHVAFLFNTRQSISQAVVDCIQLISKRRSVQASARLMFLPSRLSAWFLSLLIILLSLINTRPTFCMWGIC